MNGNGTVFVKGYVCCDISDKGAARMKPKKGNNWTAYYDPDTKRYFAEIIYTSREGREQYNYEITQDIYNRLGTSGTMWKTSGCFTPRSGRTPSRIPCTAPSARNGRRSQRSHAQSGTKAEKEIKTEMNPSPRATQAGAMVSGRIADGE